MKLTRDLQNRLILLQGLPGKMKKRPWKHSKTVNEANIKARLTGCRMAYHKHAAAG